MSSSSSSSSSSSPPSWLPPLNSHNKFEITLHALQDNSSSLLEVSEKIINRKVVAPKFVSFSLEVHVSFHSEDITAKRTFQGLLLHRRFVTSSIQTPALLATEVSDLLMNSNYVPFQLDRVNYSETQIKPNTSMSTALSLTEDAVIARLVDFLQRLISVSTTSIVGLKLSIQKNIELPKNELNAWISWYDENERVHSEVFEDEYERAIKRPRTECELMVEAMMRNYRPASKESIEELERVCVDELDNNCSDQTKSCAVCLEDLSKGGQQLRKMACSHVFHQECIVQWLNTSYMCPLCRYKLSTA